MSDAVHQTERSKISLRHLLYLTAWIAIGVAVGMAYRQHSNLTKKRSELLSVSKRLQIFNEDELVSAPMPNIADGFFSWRVHVPSGRDYELRLGIGEISEKGIPPIVGNVQLSPGQHRITLCKENSVSEKYRYVVYVDGVQAIEKVMGSEWLPSGFSSSRGVNWPSGLQASPAPLQLSAQSYEPRLEFGPQGYFNIQSDDQLTRLGYRLWIDQLDQEYPPASPFLGFPGDPQYLGIGLRDGFRFRVSKSGFAWDFMRSSFATTDPVLQVEAEFFTEEGKKFSSQSLESWQVRNAVTGSEALRWKEDPAQTVYSAFLHAKSSSSGDLQPVVEMRWDATKLDAIGFRLADTPANAQIIQWRLRILDGTHHLWREFQAGDGARVTPAEAITQSDKLEEGSKKPASRIAALNLGNQSKPNVELHWKTDEKLPLQIVERRGNRYSGLELYQGLPLSFGMQIPKALNPGLAIEVVDQHPSVADADFPGGPVFHAIRIDVQATTHDWIWLSATSNP